MKGEMVQGMDCVMDGESDSVCEGCIMGKQHRTKYPSGVAKRATEPFELVHSDVCGPMSVNSIGGSRYFVTFIDDYTRYTYVYFIKHKDEELAKFKECVNLATNLTGKSVKTLRTDNGGEYCSKEFESFLKEKGIVHQLTVPYNPAQNGVSERMNRTLV
jgi:transposase InsO family protein